MQKIEKLKESWYYIFFILFLVFVFIGLFSYFHEEIQISHFKSFTVKEGNGNIVTTEAFIIGEYRTVGEGFFVGKKISISALLYLRDKQDYNFFRNSPNKIIFIENSEDPRDSRRIISDKIKKGELKEVFTNPGTLEMIEFFDEKNTIVIQGDVIFTKEGQITFGQPLKLVIDKYKLRIEGINIAPQHIKYQIYSNKVTVLLSFIAISVAFLSLFFGFARKLRN